MRTGQMNDDDWARLARRMSEVADAPLFIDDSPNMSMMEIRAKCRRLKQRHDLKLVIIDYLQLMSSPKRVENRQQEVSEMSRSLKLLAKELDVPVIALSQLNRGPEQRTDKRPLLSDLRESGCLTAEHPDPAGRHGQPRSRFGELMTLGERTFPSGRSMIGMRLVPPHHDPRLPQRDQGGIPASAGAPAARSRQRPTIRSSPSTAGARWSESGPDGGVAIPRHVPEPIDVGSCPSSELVTARPPPRRRIVCQEPADPVCQQRRGEPAPP